MPTRFATLSDRLVTQNGVLMMGLAALLVILFTGASVDELVVLYSINVFITFSLSQLGMVKHWWQERAGTPRWKKKLFINGIGLLLTSGILISLCIVKFFEGGWLTLLVTGLLVGLAFWVKHHYRLTQKKLHRLNELVAAALADDAVAGIETRPAPTCDSNARTAVFLVNGFNGLGLHTLLAVVRMFPKVYQNFIFVRGTICDLYVPPWFLFGSARGLGYRYRGRSRQGMRRDRRKISPGAILCGPTGVQGRKSGHPLAP
jgi:K+ transporter